MDARKHSIIDITLHSLMVESLTDAPDVATSKRPPRCARFGYRIGTACAALAAVATFERART